MTHWSTGKTASTETRELMSQAKKGINHPKFTGLYVTPAGKFVSPVEAAAVHNVSARTIIRRCKFGERFVYREPGYSFEPISRDPDAISASISSWVVPEGVQKVNKAKEDHEINSAVHRLVKETQGGPGVENYGSSLYARKRKWVKNQVENAFCPPGGIPETLEKLVSPL